MNYSLNSRRGNSTPMPASAMPLATKAADGTTHLVMSLLEFMQRLAALVPRPRLRPQ
jgi:hypothetical protein